MTSRVAPSVVQRARTGWRDLVALGWVVAFVGCLVVPGSVGFVRGLPAPLLVGIALAAVLSLRRVLPKVVTYARVIPRARRNRFDLVKHLGRRPALGMAVIGYEVAAFVSSSADPRLKYLASAKVSSRIGCPF